MNIMPTVSVIIVCRNEEKYISKCLDSLILQNYPKDRLEILVVDGMSNDKTREIVQSYHGKYDHVKLLDNPKKLTPFAFNIGIKHSNSEIIMIMGAHASYKEDYISKCVGHLVTSGADNVGGVMITHPRENTVIAKAISFVLSSRFGVGNSVFRTGSNEVREVDTVFGGCYRKEIFEKIGLFNENLIRNHDLELNLRLRRMGGKILLFPDIECYYYSPSNLKWLFKQNYGNGLWVPLSAKFAKVPFSVRHLVPLGFVLSLVLSLVLALFFKPFVFLFAAVLGMYLAANVLFTVKICKEEGFKYFIPGIISFFTLHFSYGLGSIWGFIKLLF